MPRSSPATPMARAAFPTRRTSASPAARCGSTATPALINGIIPWALAQTNYTSAPAAAANTTNPDTLAAYAANGVAPLTAFTDDNFPSSTVNVRLTIPNAPIGAVTANSLLLDAN